jgi:hypothetical protein
MGDRLAHREPQPRARGLRREEGLEEARPILRLHPRPRVRHRHARPSVRVPLDAHLHPPAAARRLGRVLHQVEEHLAHPLGVGPRRRSSPHPDVHAPLHAPQPRRLREPLHHLVTDLAQRQLLHRHAPRPRQIQQPLDDLLAADGLLLHDLEILRERALGLALQQAHIPEDDAERVVDLVRHARRQPADARELLVLDELLLVRAQRLRHPVELGRQPAELVRLALGDARVQVPPRQPRRALRQPRHRPRHRVADVDPHARGEQRGAAQEQQGPQEARVLHGAHVLLERADGRIEAPRQRVRPGLDGGHQLQGAPVGLRHRGMVLGHHGGQQRLAVEPIQRVSGLLDVSHPGALLGIPGLLPEPAGERHHAGPGLGVEALVAGVAQDDGVRQVRVLVSHGRGQLQRVADPGAGRLEGMRPLVDLREPPEREQGRGGEQGHQRPEGEQQLARGSRRGTHRPLSI